MGITENYAHFNLQVEVKNGTNNNYRLLISKRFYLIGKEAEYLSIVLIKRKEVKYQQLKNHKTEIFKN